MGDVITDYINKSRSKVREVTAPIPHQIKPRLFRAQRAKTVLIQPMLMFFLVT